MGLDFKTTGRITLIVTLLIEFIMVVLTRLYEKIPEGIIISSIILIIFFLIPPVVLIILYKFGLYKNCEGYNEQSPISRLL